MAITSQKGLKFPKIDFQKKANGQTSFYSATETFLLPATANWNSNSLFAVQLDHLPALAREAIGQTIADPVLTCTDDSSTRVITLTKPNGSAPATGEVYLDVYSGIIQFNSADANKNFSITYYVKGDLIDHNAMNRIWSAGASYIVGSQSYCDYPTLSALISAGVLQNYDSVKLMDDQTTTGLTITTKLKLIGNNRKITKSGTATNSRAINFSEDLICEDVDFINWDEAGDVCLFASADVKAIITKNKAIGCTKLTNASTACTYSIVENNLPFSENVGQATTLITNNVQNKLIKAYIASTSISINDPVFLDLSDPTKCKKTSSPTDADIFLGIATNNASIGVVCNVCIAGVMDGLSGLTANKSYYISKTGTIATIALGSKPLPNVYSVLSDNQLLGSSGDYYHSFLGKALSSSEIQLETKRMNNITPINCKGGYLNSGVNEGLNLFSSWALARGATSIHNVFGDYTVSDNRYSFNTSNTPWALRLNMTLILEALYATSTLPSFSIELTQYDSGTSNLRTIDKFVYQPLSTGEKSSTLNRTIPLDIILKNTNPGAGQVQIKIVSSTGTGSPSGSWIYYFNKVDLFFIKE